MILRLISLSLVFVASLLTSLSSVFAEQVDAGIDAEEVTPIRVAVFKVDATPPVGSPLAYQVMEGKTSTLWAKGIVLLGDEKPIVMVAFDYIGIGGDGYLQFRETVAKAVGTTPNRVAIHCLHQHDAPRFNLDIEETLGTVGVSGQVFNVAFSMALMKNVADAAKKACADAAAVSHIGLGQSKVKKVASNRRIISPDGKSVLHTRWTKTKDAKVRAFPEGIIDPNVKTISFFQGEKIVGTLSFYATHPQSYYLTKKADADFPGMAREANEKEQGAMQIHFNGAGGNITAGKYNDGAKENRSVLAKRLQLGMEKSFEASLKHKIAVSGKDLKWGTVAVQLPLGKHVNKKKLTDILNDKKLKVSKRTAAARRLGIIRRKEAGIKTDITCLTIERFRMLHMPGELFIEYQLAAQKLRPDLFVAMAAYGDYAFGYIGTRLSYKRTGGYESSNRATATGPGVEKVLMKAIQKLLDVPCSDKNPKPITKK